MGSTPHLVITQRTHVVVHSVSIYSLYCWLCSGFSGGPQSQGSSQSQTQSQQPSQSRPGPISAADLAAVLRCALLRILSAFTLAKNSTWLVNIKAVHCLSCFSVHQTEVHCGVRYQGMPCLRQQHVQHVSGPLLLVQRYYSQHSCFVPHCSQAASWSALRSVLRVITCYIRPAVPSMHARQAPFPVRGTLSKNSCFMAEPLCLT